MPHGPMALTYDEWTAANTSDGELMKGRDHDFGLLVTCHRKRNARKNLLHSKEKAPALM